MIKKILESGIYYFKPEGLLEGNYEEVGGNFLFVDDIGNEYLTIHNPEFVFSEEEIAIGYIISKEDLQQKYKNISLKDAESRYYDEISRLNSIGFYIEDEHVVAIIPMNFSKILEELNEQPINAKNPVVEFNMQDITQPNQNVFLPEKNTKTKENETCIKIDLALGKSLLASKNYEEVMNLLRKIIPADKEEIAKKQQKINSAFLQEVYKKSIQDCKKIKTTEKMKNLVKQLEKDLKEIIASLKTKEDRNKANKAAVKYLNKLVLEYENVRKIEDLEDIKEAFGKVNSFLKESWEFLTAVFDTEMEEQQEEKTDLFEVRKMKEYFDQVIIGQEEAKIAIISTLFMNKLEDDAHSKNACLLIGPTGSGKTLIAETISKYYNVPLQIVDTTQQTQTGYKGDSIEDILINLLDKANGNQELAQKGVIVLNEIDKKGSEKNEDVAGRAVLNSFLPLLEGATYNITYKYRQLTFDTKDLTILATGSFENVIKAKKKTSDYKTTNMGYLNSKEVEKEEDREYVPLTETDLEKYGFIPKELLGRISNIIQLSGHTKKTLKRVLLESLVSPILLEQQKLVKVGIFLSWNEGYIEAVVEEAFKLQDGGRSLKKIIETSIMLARWEALSFLGFYTEIRLSKNTVYNPLDCELIDKNGNVYKLQDLKNKENPKNTERTLNLK